MTRLRVMTWNIRHGLGMDRVIDLERIAAVIASAGVDTVALQEVDRFWDRSGSVDQAACLGERLGMHPAFGANLTEIPGEYGNAILSRMPMSGIENLSLPSRGGSEQRGALRAEIYGITVISTHLHWGGLGSSDDAVAERRRQAAMLVETIRANPGPCLLMGDFNALPGSPDLAPLDTSTSPVRDLWTVRGAGPGFTIPVDLPLRRIDYIRASAGFECRSIEVIETPETRIASDHLPIIAEVVLVDRAGPYENNAL